MDGGDRLCAADDRIPAKSIADRHCYELDSGLYFDISTVADYGGWRAPSPTTARAVSKRSKASATPPTSRSGARRPWARRARWNGILPWGRGAPGWHLECSVMGEAELGMPFDIHTGGIDHREIHHPNEIAQNQAYRGCAASIAPNIRAPGCGCTIIS